MGYAGWDEPEREQPERDPDWGYEKYRQAKLDAQPDLISEEGAIKCCNQLMSRLQQSTQSVSN